MNDQQKDTEWSFYNYDFILVAESVFTTKCILPEIKMQGWEFSAKNHNVGEGRHGVKVSNEIQIHQKYKQKQTNTVWPMIIFVLSSQQCVRRKTGGKKYK